MNGELQVIERSPSNEVSFGKTAATALMDVVRSQKLARKFGGDKEHLYVEAWQLLGQFAGLAAEIESAEPIEVDGVKGAKARAVLKDLDGRVMGGAIAYCMRDEGNWRNKPWFQLASMAQTRAVSKAYRNRLAWIAVLAGYSGTPAEEMDGVQPAVETSGQAKSPKGREKPPAKSLEERRAKAVELATPMGYSQDDLETWLEKPMNEWGEKELGDIRDWYKRRLEEVKAGEE